MKMKADLFPVYSINSDNSARFYLGTKGSKTLIFCGLNPSTATKEKSDTTVTKVKNFASNAGYDSFLMINLYSQRSTEPEKLPKKIDRKLHKENLFQILKPIKNLKKADLVLCWGNNIVLRDFLKNCAIDIEKETQNKIHKYFCLGNLTKMGHPRHPSRISYDLELNEFDFKNYVSGIV